MEPTVVYDTYWRFAAERQAMFERRLKSSSGPWTEDPILRTHRFTNAYRVLDRVSQYLIREVQYHPSRSQSPDEVFFRTLLFKFFNKIETWELLEEGLGPLSWQSFDADAANQLLGRAINSGHRIYSAAYIMPSPPLGHDRKHANHVALLIRMMEDGLPARIMRARRLREVYQTILTYPGIGPFLAFQYTIDLNYSSILGLTEADFVVAGPGALDGISKCFDYTKDLNPEALIYEMVERQSAEFKRLGLNFNGLYGRPLQPIDCQNLFCEISKYSRVAHPEISGISGRKRIKQAYRNSAGPLPQPMLPPAWGIAIPMQLQSPPGEHQGDLFRLSA